MSAVHDGERADASAGGRPVYRIAFVNTHPIRCFAPLHACPTKHRGPRATGLYLSDFSLKDRFDPGFRRAVTRDADLPDGCGARCMAGEKAA